MLTKTEECGTIIKLPKSGERKSSKKLKKNKKKFLTKSSSCGRIEKLAWERRAVLEVFEKSSKKVKKVLDNVKLMWYNK